MVAVMFTMLDYEIVLLVIEMSIKYLLAYSMRLIIRNALLCKPCYSTELKLKTKILNVPW